MIRRLAETVRVLGIDPTSKGFGFALLEGPKSLVDWGVARLRRASNVASLARVENLLGLYVPSLLVVEDCLAPGARRCARVQDLLGDSVRLAEQLEIQTTRVSWSTVKSVLSVNTARVTKYHIASTLTRHFPELEPHLPPPRKPWMSEDERMSIFDAAAFAVTALHPQIDISYRIS